MVAHILSLILTLLATTGFTPVERMIASYLANAHILSLIIFILLATTGTDYWDWFAADQNRAKCTQAPGG